MTTNRFLEVATNGSSGEIGSSFWEKWGQDSQLLHRAQECASYTIPGLFPADGTDDDDGLQKNFLSAGPGLVKHIVGRLVLAMFPPMEPWFSFELSPGLLYDPSADPADIMEARKRLYVRSLGLKALIENRPVKMERYYKSFHSQMRQLLMMSCVTGHGLAKIHEDDFRIQNFTRHQFVEWRDHAGDTEEIVTLEVKDARAFSPEDQASAELDESILDKPREHRLVPIYTSCRWEYQANTWLIRQEVNGNVIRETEKKKTPYLSVPWSLVPGEDMGRGLVEDNIGDFRSGESIQKSVLKILANAARIVPVLDENSLMSDEDFARDDFEVVRGRVEAGRIMDMAFLQANHAPDYGIAKDGLRDILRNLGENFLKDSQIQPTGDRVTASQALIFREETQGALGDVYASIADDIQVPMVEYVNYEATKQKLLPELPDGSFEINYITGLNQLAEMQRRMRTVQVADIIQQNPNLAGRLNMGAYTELLMRAQGVYEPGLVKDDEQMAAEQQQQINAEAQAAAAQSVANQAGPVLASAIGEQQ